MFPPHHDIISDGVIKEEFRHVDGVAVMDGGCLTFYITSFLRFDLFLKGVGLV